MIKPGWRGRFYEDFEVDDVYQSRVGRTLTEADNIWFTLLTNNPNQIHFNAEYAPDGVRPPAGEQHAHLGHRHRAERNRCQRKRVCPGLG